VKAIKINNGVKPIMRKVVFLIVILTLLLISSTVFSTGIDADEPFILFVIDQISINEVSKIPTPNLDYLIDQGAVALTNSRTSGSLSPPDTYLTIGAGRRANTDIAGNYTFNTDTKYKGKNVSKLYQALTGNQLTTESIVNIRFSEIIKQNLLGAYRAHPGALGQVLKEAGKQVTVIGNSDYQDSSLEYHLGREAALIGFDSKGSIELGDVSQKTIVSTDWHPFGFVTSQQYVVNKFNELYEEAELIIIESGDTARVEALRETLLPKDFKKFKKDALQRADKLLGKILDKINLKQTRIMVVTPTPSYKARQEGKNLTLTILAGTGVKNGLLTTGTTRRLGIITNLDIAPTILNSVGIDDIPPMMIGSPVSSVEVDQPFAKAVKINEQITRTFTWRPILIKGFILLQIAVLTLAALVIIFKDKVTSFIKSSTEVLLLSLLVIPVFLILSSFFNLGDVYLVAGLFILLSLGLAFLLKRLTPHELDPILIVLNLISLLLIVDIWMGARLIKTSVLGYSPVIGARFYGIGNEFMGLLIGTILIGITGFFDRFSILEKKNHYLFLLVTAIVVITIGYPQLGANFGGLLTSLAAFTFTYGLIKEYKFNLRRVMVIIIVLSLLVGSLVLYDTLSPKRSASHIGKTVLLIKNNGLKEVFNIIYRKLSMNLKLLRWTIWTKVVVAFIFILAILFRYPVGVVRQIIDDYSHLRYGFSGVVCGSIVTMLVNDSGVVATATLLLPAVVTFVYLVIRRIEL